MAVLLETASFSFRPRPQTIEGVCGCGSAVTAARPRRCSEHTLRQHQKIGPRLQIVVARDCPDECLTPKRAAPWISGAAAAPKLQVP